MTNTYDVLEICLNEIEAGAEIILASQARCLKRLQRPVCLPATVVGYNDARAILVGFW